MEANNLSKKFGNTLAVDDISFSVNKGEIVGLLGPNGAGKTTTIQMLLGTLTQSGGSIRYFGKDFATHREEILKQVNFCSSYIRLPWRMTIWENLEVIARLYEVPNRKQRIIKLLDTFELSGFKNSFVSDLSAGQIMRLILAKAFINYPKVILLDEPTASLDPEVAQRVREFLKKEQKEFGVTILLTSHNMAEVEELSDRVIFLNQGQILAEDTPDQLAAKIDVTRIDLLIPNRLEEAAQILSEHRFSVGTNGKYLRVETSQSQIARMLTILSSAKIEYKEISIDKPDLEDFFLKMAKEGIK